MEESGAAGERDGRSAERIAADRKASQVRRVAAGRGCGAFSVRCEQHAEPAATQTVRAPCGWHAHRLACQRCGGHAWPGFWIGSIWEEDRACAEQSQSAVCHILA